MQGVNEICDQFQEQGYVGSVPVLSAEECRDFLKAARDATRRQPPLDWDKGYATSSRVFYNIAVKPAILDVVSSFLGDDVMLWSATLVSKAPNAVHPWHSDIESSSTKEKTCSVWIGLENTSNDSSLRIMPYSHHLGFSVQEKRYQHGKGRRETTNDEVIGWAQEKDERCHLMKPKMTDGEAIFFNGHLWHYSYNESDQRRWSLLLQYAVPQAEIRALDLKKLDWPFKQLKWPKPACIMVKGNDKAGVNRFVPPPVAYEDRAKHKLTSRIYPFRMPLPPEKEKGWKPYPIFKGFSEGIESMACHTSVLIHQQCPHPPHKHKEEELLLLLAGEVDLTLPKVNTGIKGHRKRLKPGEFVYYPAQFSHTIETVSEEPANYMMFKWYSRGQFWGGKLKYGHFNIFDEVKDSKVEDGFRPRRLFEGPTNCLKKLHCHVSTLTPGAGYDPHVDPYDVAIILLQGEVETIGERVGAESVIFYPAGESHGIFNPGEVTAKYIVFEFHSYKNGKADPSARSFVSKLVDPRCWIRKIKHILKMNPH